MKRKKKLSHRIKWHLINLYLQSWAQYNGKMRSYTPQQAYTILGTGRSGTTWLAALLCKANPRCQLIDEPLNLSSSHIVPKLGFTGWGQYFPETLELPDFQKFFHQLLTGQFLNPNLSRHWLPPYKVRGWLIKFIRANLLLSWLVRHFALPKPILLLRHPLYVINSQMHHSGWRKPRLHPTVPESSLPTLNIFPEFWQHYLPQLQTFKYLEQELALRWAAENTFLLRHPDHNQHRPNPTYTPRFRI